MFGKLFGNKPTTKSDVMFAFVGLLAAGFKTWDVTSRYKAEQKAQNDKENNS